MIKNDMASHFALYLCAVGEVFFTFDGHHDAHVQNFSTKTWQAQGCR